MLLNLYKNLMHASTPLLEAYLRRRLRRGKEDPSRAHERRGRPDIARGEGRIVWMHAASVGESMSMLALVDRMLAVHDDIRILVTTGTVTSAKLMAQRLPPRSFHQYVPVDHPQWVERFLDYWKPSLGIWTESELWPNILTALKKRNVPAVLVSAKITDKTARRWKIVAPGAIRTLLNCFNVCFAQSAFQAARLKDLGAKNVVTSATLKYGAAPLPVDELKYNDMKAQVGARPVVLWSSTHPGEEDIALDAHVELKRQWPDLLTIIVPRHPVRGKEIVDIAQKKGLTTAQRSVNTPLGHSDIYVADTLGEMGLFYKLCPVVAMGGSFVDLGGHNFIEPAQFGCVILTGPIVYNFQSVVEDFRVENAIIEAKSPADMTAQLRAVLSAPEKYAVAGRAAQRLTSRRSGIVDDVARQIAPFLENSRDGI